MAIIKTFGGVQIKKPGTYSKQQVLGGDSIANVSVGTLLLIGEAVDGETGSLKSFSSSQIEQLKAYYGSGPLIECALAALRPSITSGVQGAGTILTYKTNPHVTESEKGFITIKDDTSGTALDVLKLHLVGSSASNNDLVVRIKTTDLNGDVKQAGKSIQV